MEFFVDENKKIYHRPDCECVNSLQNKKHMYEGIFDMYCMGYKPCIKCSPFMVQYEQEKEEIHKFALEHGIRIKLRDECLIIDTHVSSWKLIKDLYRSKALILFHENEQSYVKCNTKNGEIMKKYHTQNCHYATIVEFLQYIIQHDKYKDDYNNKYRKGKKTTKTKRYLYNRSRTRNINIGTKRVLNLLDELNAKGGK